METLDDDICALFTRRAYDMAGCTHSSVKVYLNGKRLPTSNFSQYIDLFLGPKLAAGSLPRTLCGCSGRGCALAYHPIPYHTTPCQCVVLHHLCHTFSRLCCCMLQPPAMHNGGLPSQCSC